MSIRVTVLTIIVTALSIYSWRDWFRALCGAIVLMAFLEHPDMPHRIFEIQGFNLWNVLLANVMGGWLAQRRSEGLEWDMPKRIKLGFTLFLFVIIWAFLRMLMDPTRFYDGTYTAIVINYFVNPIKFLIPCFLLYDGCRTQERIRWGLASIGCLYFLLSAQVIRHMGVHFDFSGEELSQRAAKVISHSTGYDRVDMSMMLAGASWATLIFSRLISRKLYRWAGWGAAGLILLAQAMTGGRAGYVTWGLVGLVFCVVKWRTLLPLLPVAVIAVSLTIPGVRERMMEGFGGRQGRYVEQTDSTEITSGRTNMWPYVIEKIQKAPLLGYGRLAIVRTGLSDELQQEVGEGFGHPHNAYLEILFDDGLVGFLCVLPIYVMILRRSLSLFTQGEHLICEVAGGMTLALFLALLFAGVGAQTFYPREGVLGMWAAAGIALRVWVERERGETSLLNESAETGWTDESLPELTFGG